jgi:hypothetical protein
MRARNALFVSAMAIVRPAYNSSFSVIQRPYYAYAYQVPIIIFASSLLTLA